MVINANIEARGRKPFKLGVGRPIKTVNALTGISVVNVAKLSEAERRKHEHAVESRHRLDAAKADLQSSLNALSDANADIARLKGLVAKLESELKEVRADLQKEREKNEKAEVAEDLAPVAPVEEKLEPVKEEPAEKPLEAMAEKPLSKKKKKKALKSLAALPELPAAPASETATSEPQA